jgi:hypothetical protein
MEERSFHGSLTLAPERSGWRAVTTFIHWSGALLVCGALLLGLAIGMASLQPMTGQLLSPRVAAPLVLSAALLLPSLPGMYAAQADAAGIIGLVAYVLLEIGVLLFVVVSATPLLFPRLSEGYTNHPLYFALGVALTLGLLLTGVVTLQTGVFPTGAGILLLAGTVGFFFSFFVAEFLPPRAGQIGNAFLGAVLALGFAWIGVSMWARGQ